MSLKVNKQVRTTQIGFILIESKRSNIKSTLENFVYFLRILCIKSYQLNDFLSIYHIFFQLDFAKSCNSNIKDFKNLFKVLELDNILGFTEEVKVPFNIFFLFNTLATDTHLYLDCVRIINKRTSLVHVISLVVYFLRIIGMIPGNSLDFPVNQLKQG